MQPNDDAEFFAQRGTARAAGMHPEFSASLRRAIEDAEAATGEQVKIESLTRTRAEQVAAYSRYRSGQGALAAPPGTSRHEFGQAGDIADGKARDWLHENADKYGLSFLKGKAFAQDPGHVQWAPKASAYADDGAVPDLLGSFVKDGVGKGASPSAAEHPTADLLGSWAKGLPAAASPPAPLPAAPRGPVGAMPVMLPGQVARGPGPESLPELMNRLTAEHQGDDWTDRAIRIGAGVGRGVGDVADTLAQGITKVGAGGADALSKFGIISPQSAQAVQDWRSSVNQGIVQGQSGFEAAADGSLLSAGGRIGGQIVGTSPFLSAGGGLVGQAAGGSAIARALAARPLLNSIVSGAGAGAGAAALTSSTSDQPLMDQLTSGGMIGAALGPVGYGIGRAGSALFGGNVTRENAQFAAAARDKYGIKIRADQMSSNPMVRFLGSVAQRMPFTGFGPSAAAQQTALERALASEMGVTADKVTPDVVRTAQRTAYGPYDAAKSSMGPLPIDHKFPIDLKDIHDNAHYNLEPNLAARIDAHLRNVVDKIDPVTRTIDPDLYQSLTRKNGPLDKAINSKDSKISGYAGDIKDALENLVGRSNPRLKELKDAADYKYFVAKSVEPLADEAGSISPAKLLKAVDHSQTNAGELGRIARRFMVEPPSSGTAERTWIMQHAPQLAVGATGLGALGGATYFDPDSWQRNAAFGAAGLVVGRGAASALRSNALANAMIRSGLQAPGGGGMLELINRTVPVAGALTAGLINNRREPLRFIVHPRASQ